MNKTQFQHISFQQQLTNVLKQLNYQKPLGSYTDEEHKIILTLSNMINLFVIRGYNYDDIVVEYKGDTFYVFDKNQDNLLLIFNPEKKYDPSMTPNKTQFKKIIFITGKKITITQVEMLPQKYFLQNFISKDWYQLPTLMNEVILYNKTEDHDAIKLNNTCKIILLHDPLVQLIGGKEGQFIKFQVQRADQIGYMEQYYRLISTGFQQQQIQEDDDKSDSGSNSDEEPVQEDDESDDV